MQRLVAGVMIMHNASSYHALPALVSGLHQTVGNISSNGTGPTFTVKSHPLPLTSEESVQLDSLLMVTMPPSPCGDCGMQQGHGALLVHDKMGWMPPVGQAVLAARRFCCLLVSPDICFSTCLSTEDPCAVRSGIEKALPA